jgi:DNA gyrase subunit A
MEDKKHENIINTNIEEEMQSSYLAYAMSVIVSRALPDARDGLKPVHRRILYAMMELDLKHNSAFKKSARIVGEVMGKYHPHGDTAIYDTMVRMAQNWSLRYLLVDGQGNFGSVDGDRAAAYRYTEARMKSMAEELLADIEKETVDYQDNFDGSLREPVVLPSKFPNLLVNGSDGIAVGMATKIPPHNLSEVIDALLLYMDNPSASVEEFMKVLTGPDFPTGGYIIGRQGILNAYRTGRGRVIMRAKTHFEELSSDKTAIIVTELPYQVNKATLVENIAEMVKDKKIESISDLRDESDRNGMRIVIETKRGENPDVVLNQLLKQTSMQTSFGINMVALVQNRPETLGLLRLLGVYVSHRFDVVTRRTRYELRKAEERAHILRGLKIALENIDEVIQIIKSSSNTEMAKERLIERFGFSEIQAKAILAMRLQALTNMETQKIIDELAELEKLIDYLKSILADRRKVFDIIKKELQEIKEKYGDERRTEILDDESEMDMRDLLKEEQKLITMTRSGYLKSVPLDTYSIQGRGGKGLMGMGMKEGDFVESMHIASTFDYMMFFTNRGRCWAKYTYELPEGTRTSKGKALVNVLNLESNEKVTAMMPVKSSADGLFHNGEHLYIVMGTKKGMIKKSKLNEYISAKRERGILAVKLNDGDEVVTVRLSDNSREVVMGTRFGLAIRFPEEKVRSIGRTSQGVKGIKLQDDDIVVGMEVLDLKKDGEKESTLLVVTNEGYGKRTVLSKYRTTNRAGKGIINIKLTRKREVIGFQEVSENDEVILVTQKGKIIRIDAVTIGCYGRGTQGVRLINLDEDDSLVKFSVIPFDSIKEEKEKQHTLEKNQIEIPQNEEIIEDEEIEDEEIEDEEIEDEEIDEEEIPEDEDSDE